MFIWRKHTKAGRSRADDEAVAQPGMAYRPEGVAARLERDSPGDRALEGDAGGIRNARAGEPEAVRCAPVRDLDREAVRREAGRGHERDLRAGADRCRE